MDMATSLIQRHKLEIKTLGRKNLSASFQQTRRSDCLQRLVSWDGCRALPCASVPILRLLKGSNFKEYPWKEPTWCDDKIIWEHHNMLAEVSNWCLKCNNSLLTSNWLTSQRPSSNLTRITVTHHTVSRAGRDREKCDRAHSWLITGSWSWRASDSVTRARDRGVSRH